MNIIAGKHRGRRLATLSGRSIRPTPSRVRESLFNILTNRTKSDGQPLLQDCLFADICCGSGAIGLEALSRGAGQVLFVDNAAESLAITKRNVELLHEQQACSFLLANVKKIPAAPQPYDIIFADPPYHQALYQELLTGLVRQGWVKPDTLVITEHHSKEENIVSDIMLMEDQRQYGHSMLSFWKVGVTIASQFSDNKNV